MLNRRVEPLVATTILPSPKTLPKYLRATLASYEATLWGPPTCCTLRETNQPNSSRKQIG